MKYLIIQLFHSVKKTPVVKVNHNTVHTNICLIAFVHLLTDMYPVYNVCFIRSQILSHFIEIHLNNKFKKQNQTLSEII